ncbi:MAG: thioredoxin family protein [bacterium]
MKPEKPDLDVTQIRVGEHKLGIIGLKTALQGMAENRRHRSDEVTAEELLKQLAISNYIPEQSRDQYRSAFLREFKRFCGQPVAKEERGLLEIRVLGRQCARCDQLMADMRDLLSELSLPADLEQIKDPTVVTRFGLPGLPAVIINDRVMCAGKPPEKAQIKEWLIQATSH